ncbi:hypothetical protein GUITHDRAFT_151920 [Guillardia theta CCMP2712]|uniref:Uncharacterized protein n=1 Tax=Guillardia theta (strain CCMP2712) TaxID=905079 RepID=L1JIU3_GUITC|nr:hypothetical protein GUITHDRAFT_151920 [Guillardia theta CCMP2712]EKX48074.1 hypothetical protein GUITHDRAFT_151920 [Guillardia theta CCMP2712]|eukprot:XP_005835054.1 hypothetical protein GUITHDRAFT_151920 [Guillardia theta CCMP2712]
MLAGVVVATMMNIVLSSPAFAETVAQDVEILKVKQGLPQEVGTLMILPLIVYKIFALSRGVRLTASLDFSILAAVLAYCNRYFL